MAAPTLANAGNVIVKHAPPWSKKLTYFARRSFAPGEIPAHLEGYARDFGAAAPGCAATVKGMPSGPEKVQALNGCMAAKLRR
jgi:hypothetical protein